MNTWVWKNAWDAQIMIWYANEQMRLNDLERWINHGYNELWFANENDKKGYTIIHRYANL